MLVCNSHCKNLSKKYNIPWCTTLSQFIGSVLSHVEQFGRVRVIPRRFYNIHEFVNVQTDVAVMCVDTSPPVIDVRRPRVEMISVFYILTAVDRCNYFNWNK